MDKIFIEKMLIHQMILSKKYQAYGQIITRIDAHQPNESSQKEFYLK